MSVPSCFRGYNNDPDVIDFAAVGMCIALLGVGLFVVCIGIFSTTYFVATTFTGPCAGAGGVGTYSVDYVQCSNGKRVIYERAAVESQRYGVRIEDGAQK